MNRGGPIIRRTPLRRTAALPRATVSLPRTSKAANPAKPRAAKRKGLRRPTMDPQLRQAVYDRAEGRCDHCGLYVDPGAWECHHRLLRSRGGKDSLENLICLHPVCHQMAHLRPRWAEQRGLIVPSNTDPADVPVLRHGDLYYRATGTAWTSTAVVATPEGIRNLEGAPE